MHLSRIQIPEFRVLKDIDITFEKEFYPRIFPLGSLNGGGKSTLLQLIFVLLHCSNNSKRLLAVRNMLNGFKIFDDTGERTLAKIDIWDGEQTMQIEFLCYNDDYLKKMWASNENALSLSIFPELEYVKKKIFKLRNFPPGEEFEEEYRDNKNKEKKLSSSAEKIQKYFNSMNLTYVVNFDNEKNTSLFYRIVNLDVDRAKIFLNELSKKIFLAAPITQVYLFFSRESKDYLLKKDIDSYANYCERLKNAKSILQGFFTYDFLAVDLLVESFKIALDRDKQEAIETDGKYGSNYKMFLDDLKNLFLGDKKVVPQSDLSGITFKTRENVELHLEDLSHGELKRLSIYAWLKYHNIEDAIILMDEIEIALHPDWQYKIVSDLMEWAPNNQYILATHSYELCQALTPAHVKELEPKLIKPLPNDNES